MNLKTCAKCNEPEERPLFKSNLKSKDGLSSWCEPCWVEYRRSHVPNKPKLKATKEGHKVCRRCSTEKAFHEFAPNKNLKDGLNTWCNPCCNEYQKKRYISKRKPRVPKIGAFKEARPPKPPRIPKPTTPKSPKEVLPEGLKRCRACKEVKEATLGNFRSKPRYSDDLDTACKICVRKAQKAWADKNRSRVTAVRRSYNEKNKEATRERQKLWARKRYLRKLAEQGKTLRVKKEAPTSKACHKCGNFVPLTEFIQQGGGRSHRYCYSCRKEKIERRSALLLMREAKLTCPEGFKICTKCKLTKEANLVNFGSNRPAKDGLTPRCRECSKGPSKLEWAKKEGHKLCRLCKEEKLLECFRIQRGKAYFVCKSCESEEKRIKIRNSPEKYKAIGLRTRAKFKNDPIRRRKALDRDKNRYHSDPQYRLVKNIRSLTSAAFKKAGFKKNSKTAKILGCSFEVFISHMAKQLTGDMTIENYGKFWHIDHYFPLAEAVRLTQQNPALGTKIIEAVSHYKNLRPMIGPENLSKSDTVPDVYIMSNGTVNLDLLLTLI